MKEGSKDSSFLGTGYGYSSSASSSSKNTGLYKYDKPVYSSKDEPLIDFGYGLTYNKTKAQSKASNESENKLRQKEKERYYAEKVAKREEKEKARQEKERLKHEQLREEEARLIALKNGNIAPDSRVKNLMQTIECLNCRQEVREGDFCPECGCILHPIECPHCKEIVPARDTCNECGKRVNKLEQLVLNVVSYFSEKKHKKAIDDVMCPNCMEYVGNKQETCLNCGYLLTTPAEYYGNTDNVECPNCLSNVPDTGICAECGFILDE